MKQKDDNNVFEIDENDKNMIWLSCEDINDQMQNQSVKVQRDNGFSSLWHQNNQPSLNVLKL